MYIYIYMYMYRERDVVGMPRLQDDISAQAVVMPVA